MHPSPLLGVSSAPREKSPSPHHSNINPTGVQQKRPMVEKEKEEGVKTQTEIHIKKYKANAQPHRNARAYP